MICSGPEGAHDQEREVYAIHHSLPSLRRRDRGDWRGELDFIAACDGAQQRGAGRRDGGTAGGDFKGTGCRW